MPAYITLDGLSYSTPDGRLLFEDLTLAFGAERTGLVGRNGVGKTTLVRLMLGELAPTSGAVSRRGRLASLAQALAPPPAALVADLLGVAEGFARLRRIERGQAYGDDLELADWTLEARLEAALGKVGLAGLDPFRSADTLSGGQVTRSGLARLLLEAPDMLILDEPTNNLDAESRAMVARLLAGWDGGALVISHDRALLREMDRIVDLTSLGARIHGGGYDAYAERKALDEAAAARDLDQARRAAARVERDVQASQERKKRRDAAGRRHAASGSAPRIVLGAMARRAEESGGRQVLLGERLRRDAAAELEDAAAKVERLRRLGFALPPSGLAGGRTVLAFEDVGLVRGGRAILSDLSFRITGPERVALTGPNGAGKTTLLRLAAGEFEPTSGEIRLGVRAAYLDQRTAGLQAGETLVETFRRLNPAAGENAARTALARFLFRNADADKRVDALSGGERLRAALACLLNGAASPQLLMLDEPTNHLDLDSTAAMETALRGYDGALLVASHDRDFLRTIRVEREILLGEAPASGQARA